MQQPIHTAYGAALRTDCDQSPLLFQDLGPRKVVADFAGGHLSTDGGALLLRQLDQGLGLTRALATCFQDQRDQRFVEHSLQDLVAQRVYGLALGYEDLNDHQQLRTDPLLAVCVGKQDPLATGRAPQDRGKALAAPSTLNRLELSNQKQTKAHKIRHDPAAIRDCLLRRGARALPKDTKEVILDFDSSDHPLHGTQEGARFHAYYDTHCYLPLFCFVGDVPLWAELRTAESHPSNGALDALQRIVAEVRRRLPKARLILRADAGFCRDAIMAWSEANGVYYVLGKERNARLEALLAPAMHQARTRHCLCGGAPTRVFAELRYRTLQSWTRERRVIGKAEVTALGDNPRFIVTNLPAEGEDGAAQVVYEKTYCGRGQMENQIKQLHLDLQGTRMSTHYLGSNQLRLWLSVFAYLLLVQLRTIGLHGTELARATLGSVQRRLLKIAAQVRISVRRVHASLASAFALQDVFRLCQQRLAELPAAG